MKKVLYVIVAIIGIQITGPLLYRITRSGVLSNWGTIIIPCIIVGIVMSKYNKDLIKDNNYLKVLGLSCGTTKLVSNIITINNLTVLAAILIIIINSVLAYYCVKISGRSVE